MNQEGKTFPRRQGGASTVVVACLPVHALQLLLDHGLRGNACVVCPRHPQRVAAAHAMPPRQRVLPHEQHDLSCRACYAIPVLGDLCMHALNAWMWHSSGWKKRSISGTNV